MIFGKVDIKFEDEFLNDLSLWVYVWGYVVFIVLLKFGLVFLR